MNLNPIASHVQPIVDRHGIREVMRRLRSADRSIGLVPTMGAFHEGHLSLVRASVAAHDETIVTIFVNPSQFGPTEDLDSYPRSLEQDLAELKSLGVEHIFAPSPEMMYPAAFSTYVQPPEVASRWEGTCRPGHFRGVTTVVLKLFNLIPADVAFFGEKDYQQWLVIRRMVADLDLRITLRLCPTIRDSDGLALSSRNRRLSLAHREQASAIPRALFRARELFRQGERHPAAIEEAIHVVLRDAGVERLDYVAVVDPDTLRPLQYAHDAGRVIIAANVGGTRLIDNLQLGGVD